MSGEVNTSRRYLDQQYGDDRNLAARQSIYSFQQPQLDLYNSSLDLAALSGSESVLDIGCGNGRFLEALRARGHRGVVVGADLSAGMVRTAKSLIDEAPVLVSDAQSLPFAAESFDVALAMHMLYHVPDRAQALAELRRVVRPGGLVLALTNSASHFIEVDEVLTTCAAAVDTPLVLDRPSLTLFSVESAMPVLEPVFSSVTLHRFASELAVTETEPLVAYVRSMGAFVRDDTGRLDAVLVELERRVGETIAAEGAFRVTTACGCFVCR